MKGLEPKSALNLILISLFFLASSDAMAQGAGIRDSLDLYQQNCATCHGQNLEGEALGRPLLGDLLHGETIDELVTSIGVGFAAAGMPGWSNILDAGQIRDLAFFIAETRARSTYADFNLDQELIIPEEVINTELHDFRLETVATGIDPLPFSIAPLPDGRILLTEKKFGLRIVEANGELSDYIEGTPQAYSDTYIQGNREWGWGWILDIALHPQYEENGWIYLNHGDRCERCNLISRMSGNPVSMARVVRGKIKDGVWLDEETIWQADVEDYGTVGEIGGGRLTFDDSGRVYLSVGAVGIDPYYGIQNLDYPWGKIHRMNSDGSIPADNPFVNADIAYPSIYTYGHRNPQGLEFNPFNGRLYNSEHGPRGGDEINILEPGGNYGWPLYSLGLNYDTSPVDYGPDLGISWELSDIEQPVVDLTPSPAVSSFIISTSDQFPNWRGNFLAGALKASSLYRFEIEDDDRLVHRETLLEGLGRIRDIEQGYNGEIYLLLEHNAGSKIVSLVPVTQ